MNQQLWQTFFYQQDTLVQVEALVTVLLQQTTALQATQYWELWHWLKVHQLIQGDAQELQEVLHSLLSCQELILPKSNLQVLPTQIGLLWGLRKINIAHNNLQQLPISIGQLPLLQSLILAHNHLQNIPESTGQILPLKHLDISYNEVEELPDSIAWLQQLEQLDCSNNKLSQVPPDVAWLEQLKILNLSNNAIVSLPAFLTSGNTTVQVDLRGNPLEPAALALFPPPPNS